MLLESRREKISSALMVCAVGIVLSWGWFQVAVAIPPFVRYDADGRALLSALEIVTRTGYPPFNDQPNYVIQYVIASIMWLDMHLVKGLTCADYRGHVVERLNEYMILPCFATLLFMCVATLVVARLSRRCFGPATCFIGLPLMLVCMPQLQAPPLHTHPDWICDYAAALGVVMGCDGAKNRSTRDFVNGCSLLAFAGILKLNFFASLVVPFAALFYYRNREKTLFHIDTYRCVARALAFVSGISLIGLAPFWIWPEECIRSFLGHTRGMTESHLDRHITLVIQQCLVNIPVIAGAILSVFFLKKDIAPRWLVIGALTQLAIPLFSMMGRPRYYRQGFFILGIVAAMLPPRFLKKPLDAAIEGLAALASGQAGKFKLYHAAMVSLALASVAAGISLMTSKMNAYKKGACVAVQIEELANIATGRNGKCIWVVASMYAPPALGWNSITNEVTPDLMPPKDSPMVMEYLDSDTIEARIRTDAFLIVLDQAYLDYLERYHGDQFKRIGARLRQGIIIRQFDLPEENKAWMIAGRDIAESICFRIQNPASAPLNP
ncbi:MAG TPA: hypothetical protein PL033_10390 [Candidatus Brocadiia bacterium]|nr:hypothetical protein [Candidatus Brocadiia bacterium]